MNSNSMLTYLPLRHFFLIEETRPLITNSSRFKKESNVNTMTTSDVQTFSKHLNTTERFLIPNLPAENWN